MKNIAKLIKEINPQIAGAIGEAKVLSELKKLSSNYIIINDFKLNFSSPIYNKKNNDRIHSIQVDHLVISQAGVFLLETKNWSKQSINSSSLRSPVKQIQRSSFALYTQLYNAVKDKKIKFKNSNWGNRHIPLKNIIIMVNNKPNEQYQYVKIKSIDEINGYLEYFKPIFDLDELECIKTYLLAINNKKHL